jgi:transposase
MVIVAIDFLYISLQGFSFIYYPFFIYILPIFYLYITQFSFLFNIETPKMTRKQRKILTEEIYQIIISMIKSQNYSVGETAKIVNLSRQTVSKVVSDYEKGITFVTADKKRRNTCKNRNVSFTSCEQCIYNTVSTNNSLILKEIKSIVNERTDVNL